MDNEAVNPHSATQLAIKQFGLEAEIERLKDALEKIAKRYPCETADAMSRVAREALGLT